jgi:hypothetical protein
MDIQLPKYAKNILENYLIPLNPGAQEEMLLLALNIYTSRILCHNRVKIYGYDTKPIYPNIYGLTFAISGAGKDRAVKTLADCYKPVENEHYTLFENMRKSTILELEDYAKKRTKESECEKTGKKLPKWSLAVRNKYVEDNTPREIQEEMSNATPEGFVAIREAISDIDYGSLHFGNSEFIDYIVNSGKSNKEDILDLLKDCYEFGDNGSKITKGDKTVKKVRDVPQTMLVFSSVAGLLKDGMATSKLEAFFRRGFARRSLVCYPSNEKNELKDIPYAEYKKTMKKASEYEQIITELFSKAHDYTNKNITQKDEWEKVRKVIIDDPALEEYMYEYDQTNKKLANEVPDHEAEPFKSIHMDHRRKVTRLAANITVFRNPTGVDKQGNYHMTVEDFEYARQQVEFYYQQFYKFYNRVEVSDVELIYNFIIREQDKQKINKTLLRKQKFVPKNRSTLKHWLEDMLNEQLPEFCEMKDKKWVETLVGKSKYPHYRIEDKTKPKELPDSIEVSNDDFLGNFPNHCFQTFDDKGIDKSLTTVSFKDDALKSLNDKGAGIYFTPNQFKNGRKQRDCIGINAWFVENDDNTFEEQYAEILKSPLEPSIVVKSGKSLHIYWLSKETIKDSWEELKQRFRPVQKGLIQHFKGDTACKDTSRVFRMPNYNHNKAEPIKVEVIKYDPSLKYTEKEMMSNYPYTEEIKKEYTPPKKVEINSGTGFWDALGSLDNKTVLQILSGQSIMNGEVISFRKRQGNTWYIDVNGDTADAWLDEQGMIGSGKGGSPTWIQWLGYYGVNKGDIARWAKDNLSGLVPPEILSK